MCWEEKHKCDEMQSKLRAPVNISTLRNGMQFFRYVMWLLLSFARTQYVRSFYVIEDIVYERHFLLLLLLLFFFSFLLTVSLEEPLFSYFIMCNIVSI